MHLAISNIRRLKATVGRWQWLAIRGKVSSTRHEDVKGKASGFSIGGLGTRPRKTDALPLRSPRHPIVMEPLAFRLTPKHRHQAGLLKTMHAR